MMYYHPSIPVRLEEKSSSIPVRLEEKSSLFQQGRCLRWSFRSIKFIGCFLGGLRNASDVIPVGDLQPHVRHKKSNTDMSDDKKNMWNETKQKNKMSNPSDVIIGFSFGCNEESFQCKQELLKKRPEPTVVALSKQCLDQVPNYRLVWHVGKPEWGSWHKVTRIQTENTDVRKHWSQNQITLPSGTPGQRSQTATV